MPENDVEVFRLHGKWRLRIAGRQILAGEYDTRSAAVRAARELARESVLESSVPKVRTARTASVITIPGLYLG